MSGVSSYVGEKCDTYFQCISNFALARDWCIYLINEKGRMFKIETNRNEDDEYDDDEYGDGDTNDSNDNTSSWAWIADIIESFDDVNNELFEDAVMGSDGCVYWLPKVSHHCTLKYHHPHIDHTSYVGNNFVQNSL